MRGLFEHARAIPGRGLFKSISVRSGTPYNMIRATLNGPDEEKLAR